MSDKNRYIFNKRSQTYERVSLSKRRHLSLRRYFVLILIGVVLTASALVVNAMFAYKESPKNIYLANINRELVDSVAMINQRVEQQNRRLTELQMRDNRLYRSVFGMEPIPTKIRNAGYVGVDRYNYLYGFDNSEFMIQSHKQMDIVTKKAYLQSKSFDDIQKLSKRAGDMANAVPSIYPVEPSKRVRNSSSYGYRFDPFRNVPVYHQGFDIAGPKGEPIYATGDGVVVEARFNYAGYGNIIEIDHGFGYRTRYAHLQRIEVVKGLRVKRGERIGTLGNSGRSTGPHLHYEVIYMGRNVNPWNYFDNTITEEEYKKITTSANLSREVL